MLREKKLFQLLPSVRLDSPAATLAEPVGLSALPYMYGTFNRIVGLEFEIEECAWMSTASLGKHFSFERDSSLRGESAYELKTHFPHRLWQSLAATKMLYEAIDLSRKTYGDHVFSFSERTSTHVHVDVRDLTLPQLKSVIRMYLLFERSFFEFTGRERFDNIFCIPLSQAQVLADEANIEQYIFNMQNGWEKYCALNIACVPHFGSVEFRGMGGQENPAVVCKFAIMAASLVEFCKQHSEEDVVGMLRRIKYESQYEELAKRVFGDYAQELTYFPGQMDAAASLSKLIR